ncbi:hypothetical protein V6O07_22615 [Arthrospira platensis SPKY2]
MSSLVRCKKKLVYFGKHSQSQISILRSCFNQFVTSVLFNLKKEEKINLFLSKKLKKINNKPNYDLLKEKLILDIPSETLELLDQQCYLELRFIKIQLFDPDSSLTKDPSPGLFTNKKGFIDIFIPNKVLFNDSLSFVLKLYIEFFLSREKPSLRNKIFIRYDNKTIVWIQEEIISNITKPLNKDWNRLQISRKLKTDKYNKNNPNYSPLITNKKSLIKKK